jgi:hypothetical protein
MPLIIKKPEAPKMFVLNRTLHLDAEGKVVEENDPAGKKVLGGKGSSIPEDEAKQYGLDDSYREGYVAPKEEPKEKAEQKEKADKPKTEPKAEK